MSALKSFKRFDSNSSTSTNRSRFSQQTSYKQEQKQYIGQLLEKTREEKYQRQQELKYNQQNQYALQSQLEQLEENYEKFYNMLEELAENINDKIRSRNVIIAASAFLGGIFSFLTYGVSAIVGGATAYGAKCAYDYQINNLRRRQINYQDRMLEFQRLYREKKHKLQILFDNQYSLNKEIRDLRAYETKLFKQYIH